MILEYSHSTYDPFQSKICSGKDMGGHLYSTEKLHEKDVYTVKNQRLVEALLPKVIMWARNAVNETTVPITVSGTSPSEIGFRYATENSDIVSLDCSSVAETLPELQIKYGRPIMCSNIFGRPHGRPIEMALDITNRDIWTTSIEDFIEGRSQLQHSYDSQSNKVAKPEEWNGYLIRNNMTPYNLTEVDLLQYPLGQSLDASASTNTVYMWAFA